MTHQELVDLLRALYVEMAAFRRRHEMGARAVRQYDRNNTYQYILAREDGHLAWLRDALAAEGAGVPAAGPDPALPPDEHEVIEADRAALAAFVDRWVDRVGSVPHARHRLLLELLVGESREQLRFFGQAASGRTDLLGRRTAPSPPIGDVLSARWVG